MSQNPENENNRYDVSPLLASAFQLHELFSTLVEAGFTRKEALQIVIEAVRPKGN